MSARCPARVETAESPRMAPPRAAISMATDDLAWRKFRASGAASTGSLGSYGVLQPELHLPGRAESVICHATAARGQAALCLILETLVLDYGNQDVHISGDVAGK